MTGQGNGASTGMVDLVDCRKLFRSLISSTHRNKKAMTEVGVVMAIDVGEHLPQDFDELDALASKIYKQGVEAGKISLRADVKDFLNREILAAKGKERRPDPDDP